MAFTYNSAGRVYGLSSADPIQFNFTAGANSKLVVLTLCYTGAAAQGSSGTPTYNSLNMSACGVTQTSQEGATEIWYYLSPDSETERQISIPNAPATDCRYCCTDYLNSSADASFFGSGGASDGDAADVPATIADVPDGSVCVSCMVHGEKDEFASISVGTTLSENPPATPVPSFDEGSMQTGAAYSIQSGTGTETHTYVSGGTADDYNWVMGAWEELVTDIDINAYESNPDVTDFANVVIPLYEIDVNDTITITGSSDVIRYPLEINTSDNIDIIDSEKIIHIPDSTVMSVDTTNVSAGSSNSDQFKLPLVSGGTYNFTVYWGDGNKDIITVYNQAETTHTYNSEGTYEIVINGTCYGWKFGASGDRLKLLDISQWGNLRLGNNNSYFSGCSNLVITATDNLDMTGTTSLIEAFRDCTSLTTVPSMNSWDVSNVTFMLSTFKDASSFNQNISSWVTSSCLNMSNMFDGCTLFNQNIGSWSVGSVTNMSYMFRDAIAFDQNITGWDVSSVEDMQFMFYGATLFNQAIGAWTTTSLNTIQEMFHNATAFNQNLNNWDVSNVTIMSFTFRSSSMNSDISDWDVSKVTTMQGMFETCPFNQDIINWVTSSVQIFQDMFFNNTVFNQDISDWNTSAATNMSGMFYGATSFDQNLGDWDVADVTNMTTMFDSVTLSTYNYSNLLIGWSKLSLQNSVTFDGGNSKYYSGDPASDKAYIETTYSWTITDGGQVEENIYIENDIGITDYIDVSVTTIDINIDVAESNPDIIDSTSQYITPYLISIDDDIGLQDISEQYLTVYEINVADDLGLQDVSEQFLNLYVVYSDDDIAIEDSSSQYLDKYLISTDDDLAVEDYVNARSDVNIYAFDNLAVDDFVSQYLSLYEVNVDDDLSVQDESSQYLTLYEVNVSDDLEAQEDISLELSYYEINVANNTEVTDYADIQVTAANQLYITVNDDIGLQDSTAVQFDKYLISVDDDLAVEDSISSYLTIYLIEQYDSLTVTDFSNVSATGVGIRNISVYDDLAVQEYDELFMSLYVVSVSDNLDLQDFTDNAFDLFLISESDSLTVADNIDSQINPYFISEYDSVTVTEYNENLVVYESRSINVSDDISLSDYANAGYIVYPFLQAFFTIQATRSKLNVKDTETIVSVTR